jgi:hypothetical protein
LDATWKTLDAPVLAHVPNGVSYPDPTTITGPDTGLIAWMNAHRAKDYQKADTIRKKLGRMGYVPGYAGTHYVMHATKQESIRNVFTSFAKSSLWVTWIWVRSLIDFYGFQRKKYLALPNRYDDRMAFLNQRYVNAIAHQIVKWEFR